MRLSKPCRWVLHLLFSSKIDMITFVLGPHIFLPLCASHFGMRKQGISRMCCCVQSQLEKTKADYEKRVSDIKREAEDLRTEIAGLQAAKAELESAQRNAENDIQQARDEAAQRVRQAQVGCTSHKYLAQNIQD